MTLTSDTQPSSKNWARELASGLVTQGQLAQEGLVSDTTASCFSDIEEQFHTRIPQVLLEQIKTNPALAKQFVPSADELVFYPEELDDPIGDDTHSPVEGITHRYPDRVLLKPTYMCGVYCRFCFRRNKVSHAQFNLKADAYSQAITYIANNSQIWEVILTGGDPLVLTDNALKKIFSDLSKIEHVSVIRIHTRIPVVLPSRIQASLVEIFKETQKTVWISVHINSAQEFTQESISALNMLTENGFPLVMQSVLLKGINDTEDDLVTLFKAAVKNKIKPYYLHYPDLAKGTHHFRVPLKKAIELVKNLRGKISGLCIPHFIVDIPGGKGKIAMNAHTAMELHDNNWTFESPITGETVTVTYPVA